MKKIMKYLVPVLLAVLLIWHLCDQNNITMTTVLQWQPENLYLAAAVILCIYAVKSVLVFVPIMIPQVLTGHLYGREIAILINLLGLVIIMAVPYWIGRCRGSAKMEQLLQKYPKIQRILKAQNENQMAFSFMLRACAVPPADVVTMYLGSTRMPFLTNVIGGVLGCFPSMVLTTFLGANIRNPDSPAFWQALALNVAWIGLSSLGFWLFKRFHKEAEA